jgi:tRNA(Ile)-lysidine synthase
VLTLLKNHIENELPFIKGKRILVAVSGGIDSMVLADLLLKLHFQIAVLHCNFQLRSYESDADAILVQNWTQINKLDFFTKKFETTLFAAENNVSIQMAARDLRYDWFEEIRAKNQYDYIATAHHLEDQLETFIINLSRGTGLDGLLGIPQLHRNIVRPLSKFSKEQIQQYAAKQAIVWREDASNASDKYLRNKIRHHIVPTLKSLNPTFLQNFQQTLHHLKQSQSLVNEGYEMVFKNLIVHDHNVQICAVEKLVALKNYPAFLYEWLKGFGFKAWLDIESLVHAETGKYVESEGFILQKEYGNLVLQPQITKKNNTKYFIYDTNEKLNLPLRIDFKMVEKVLLSNPNTIFVDFDILVFPLQLRNWQENDVFYPFGMIGKKKLTKFFKDAKIPQFQKQQTWVLCSGSDIIWIVGFRADNRFKVTKQTKNIIQINLKS